MLQELNSEQRRAVETIENLMIIAGPGTGKTKTIVAKIDYLMHERSVPAEQILAITFTKKAAQELKERIHATRSSHASIPLATTFHALAYSLLQEIDPVIKTFTIATDAQLREISKKFSSSPKDFLLQISRLKNSAAALSPEEAQLLAQYTHGLSEQQLIDYDDILLKAIACKLPRQWSHILVDEFQDTNTAQYKFLMRLRGADTRVCVVGDPLQSIYGFRGGDIQPFELFPRDVPDAREITLRTNYRSTPEIISTSHRLFPDSVELAPATTDAGDVQLITTFNERTEAEYIISHIQSQIGGFSLNETAALEQQRERGFQFSDVAVVFRTREFARTLERTFRDSGIPYQFVGGKTLYEYSEIVLLISCLKFVATHDVRVISSTASAAFIAQKKSALLAIDTTKLFVDIFAEVSAVIAIEQLHNDQPNKLHRIQEFKNILVQYGQLSLIEALRCIDELIEHHAADTKSDSVSLLTMHAAKGLEFNHVFICGFEDGIIPYTKKLDTQATIEEEKRLLYVAMTRAKQHLYVMHTTHRYKQRDTARSRFYSLIAHPPVKEIIDPAIEVMQRRRQYARERKSQLSLF